MPLLLLANIFSGIVVASIRIKCFHALSFQHYFHMERIMVNRQMHAGQPFFSGPQRPTIAVCSVGRAFQRSPGSSRWGEHLAQSQGVRYADAFTFVYYFLSSSNISFFVSSTPIPVRKLRALITGNGNSFLVIAVVTSRSAVSS